jgi:GntR family transcriptional regulator
MEGMPRVPELPSVRVAEDLRRRMESGEWAKDAPLPAVAELAKHYGVARATVAKALRILESEGLVRIVPRWGTFRV